MTSKVIRTFNPFSLQDGYDKELHLNVMQVVYYGESRFRAAVTGIVEAPSAEQKWMQAWLREELVISTNFSHKNVLLTIHRYSFSHMLGWPVHSAFQ